MTRSAAQSVLAAGIALLLVAAISPASAAQPACDRACLRRLLDSYLIAVFRHDPAAAPLAANHRATENATAVKDGEGFWQVMSGYGPVQRRFFDPVTGNAAYLGHVNEGLKSDIVSVRIRVEGGSISEAEWTVAREGSFGMFEAAGLASHPPPEDMLPAPKRSSRFMMISLANDYFQGLQDHDGSWVPHSDKCERIENGVRVTFRPRSAPLAVPTNATAAPAATAPVTSAAAAPVAALATPTAAQESLSGNCLDNFEGFRNSISEAALRRFPLVDEEAGVVMGNTVFRRPVGSASRRNLLTEYFFVRGDRIDGVWAAMYYLAPEQPFSSGWENR